MMENKRNIIIGAGAIILIVLVLIGFSRKPSPSVGYAQSSPTFITASSTTFTIGNQTGTQRILATSTPGRRVAVLIQNINSTAGNALHINTATGDAPPTANNGIAVLASTSQSLLDYPELPVIQNAVRAIVPNGTSTVIVTEWRLQY